ncbi:hypothetical protein [Paenibacillus sp. VTT E-133291]|uniref:hypothetical protein n=1 Tax=Paenibacillus sp. VTT E-133291 TaxID=1986223 RepID=UPI0011804BA4|nr:hypothetical protein [Paenibacillus sp. VTT E-133291]
MEKEESLFRNKETIIFIMFLIIILGIVAWLITCVVKDYRKTVASRFDFVGVIESKVVAREKGGLFGAFYLTNKYLVIKGKRYKISDDVVNEYPQLFEVGKTIHVSGQLGEIERFEVSE